MNNLTCMGLVDEAVAEKMSSGHRVFYALDLIS
jgi:hypothetical protein